MVHKKRTANKLADWLNSAKTSLQEVSENPSWEAQLLLSEVLDKPRAWIAAHPEFDLQNEQAARLDGMLRRVAGGEPLPYVLGRWQFYGLDVVLSPQVLIPRPETELLVQHALQWFTSHPQQRRCADIGTGSGCIAAALAVNVPDLLITALDISPEALNTARETLQLNGVLQRVRLEQSDLLQRLEQDVDVLCANLPYIPTRTLEHLAVLEHEPRLALDGGEDGLRLIERLMAQIFARRQSPCLLLFEIEASQGASSAALARRCFPRALINVLTDPAGRQRLLRIEALQAC